MIIAAKIWIKARHSVTLTGLNCKNSFELQNYLNEKYGLRGWLGFEILKEK